MMKSILTEIKKITGNSINDEELTNISSKDEESFVKMRFILNKRKSREKYFLGQDQNES